MSAKIGSLFVDIALETGRFKAGINDAQSSMDRARRKMEGVASAIAGAFAIDAVADAVTRLREMSKAAIDAAGNLGEQAAALGISTTALQEYRYAATQVNLTNADVDTLFQQLTRRTGDAAQGVKESADAFKRLGIDIRDANGNVKDAATLMPEIADGLKRIPSEAERAAIMVDLFGRSGQKAAALFEGGSKGLAAYADAAHRLGIVLSEGEIAKADEVADKIAVLNYQIEAQSNKKLLQNADSILRFESALANLKLGAIDAVVTLDTAGTRIQKFMFELGRPMRETAREVASFAVSIPARLGDLATGAVNAMAGMVQRISQLVTGKLNSIWNGVLDKVEVVKKGFFGLYDATVGHSYIPDMVDGIEAQMARLQSVMVDPALRATDDAKAAFRALASDVSNIMDRLFPEIAKFLSLRNDLDTIDKGRLAGLLTPEQAQEASTRARAEARGTGRAEPVVLGTALPTVDWGKTMGAVLDDVIEKLGFAADKSKVATVRIADSFKDMAEKTLGALRKMTDAIKGGGFLDILDGIIGLGLQLGSIGVFGSKIAANINRAVPGYASGTDWHPGGMAMVGEKGPELVNLPRGSQVFSNNDTKNMLKDRQRIDVVPSPYFDVVVDGRVMRAAPSIAHGGAQIAGQQAMFARSRRLG